jgi:hypothetical protein
VVLAVAVIIAAIFVIANKTQSTNDPGKEDPNDDVASSPQPDNGSPGDANPDTSGTPVDADAAIKKAISSIQTRLSPDIESHKRDLRVNATNFKVELGESIPADDALIQRNFELWKADNYRIPAALPQELREYSGVGALHTKFLAAQVSLHDKLSDRVELQSGLYILALENQIEPLDENKNGDTIRRIEEEIRRVQENLEYFSSLMLN